MSRQVVLHVLGLTALAGTSLVLASCQTAGSGVSPQLSATLTGSTVVVATEYPPDLYALRTANNVSMETDPYQEYAEGKQIVHTTGLQDPAIAVGEVLGQKILGKYGMQRVPADPAVVVPGNPETLVPFFPGADYLLVVNTIDWSYGYFPLDWAHYRVRYSARFRLIDAASRVVVAQGTCSTTQSDKQNRPDMSELMADEAAVLKSFFARAATACVGRLLEKV